MVIWKHTFAIVPDPQRVVMTDDAVILSVQVQDNAPTMWFRCDPQAPPAPRWFVLMATGVEFTWNDAWQYHGTVQVSKGRIFHLWEVPVSRLSCEALTIDAT